MTDSPWLTRGEAASYLRVSVSTMNSWAAAKPPKGPPFWKPSFSGAANSASRYHRGLLERWAMRDPHVPQGLQGDYEPVRLTSKSGEEEVVFMQAEQDHCLATSEDMGSSVTKELLEAEFWRRAEACADFILKRPSAPASPLTVEQTVTVGR